MRRTLIDNRYAPLSELGGGGMAKVYLARDEVLGRDVALKVLREQYADDEGFVERFKREAKNAAALNHPHIVQVYDQGQAEDDIHYMAMEYVPGGTLKDRIAQEGPLDPNEAAGIALRVADALDAAHGRGIVHRDVKPQNVLLTATGAAKVADFGIARAASSKTLTETNLVLGTAAYMSPEQVSSERVGPASDLYSLGVVLYEMLTGRLPYEADSPIATAMKHLDEPPRHPREANPRVPEELDALTAKLLAKNPEDRYASAAELAGDLQRIRDGLSPLAAGLDERTTAPVAGLGERTHTSPTLVAPARERRRGLLPLIALLLGVALLGGLAWALSRGLTDQEVGVGRTKVPDVVGLMRDEAEKRLEDAGFKLGSQDEAPSDEVAAGAVVEQNPAAGTEAKQGIAVDLVVSTGPDPAPTTPASPSATSSATSSATPTPSASPASPAIDEGAKEAAQEAREEVKDMAKERQKELREAQKELREAAKERQEEGKEK